MFVPLDEQEVALTVAAALAAERAQDATLPQEARDQLLAIFYVLQSMRKVVETKKSDAAKELADAK